MAEFLSVLAIALLPAGGNLAGVAFAEIARTPKWVTGAALHAAAGIAIAVVSIELMPRIIRDTAPWALALAFLLGAAFSVLIARSVTWARGRCRTRGSGPWMVYAATGADLLSDGLMTGIGTAVSSSLGLLLGVSQVVANIPGGFATIADLRSAGVGRARRLAAAASFVLPVVIGLGLGFGLLRDATTELQSAALAFVAGVLLLATVEDTVPEADKPGIRRSLSTTSFSIGFAAFALLALYIG